MDTSHVLVDSNEMPWLIFRLKEQAFAVNVKNVVTILRMPESVNPVPEYPDNFRGIMNLRGDIIPIVEMRKLMNMETVEAEYQDFTNMLEQRKQDHIHWVDELKRCLAANETFTLATDPHKCAFGKWYDHYQSDRHSIQFHLNKIDAPHKALHRMADEAFSCLQEHDKCKREVCVRTALGQAANNYMPQVVHLLEEAKEIFKSSYREMCIVISNGTEHLGLAVDEVDAVGVIERIEDTKKESKIRYSPLIEGIASSDATEGMIFVLSDGKLFEELLSIT